MPTFTVSLAHDVTYYGLVSVEGDTWQEAVASLTLDDWDECYEQSDRGWEQRVVRVEAEGDGNIVAEDLAYSTEMVHHASVIQRLREIQIAPDQDAALSLYIDELRTMVQDPIFTKKEADQ
jgi:hypothetical protein